jgi:hypothetical protein
METFYYLAKHAHSGWRWIALVLLILAVLKMNMGMKKGSTYTDKDRKLGLFTLIAFHLQFVGGLILFFVSPKVQFVGGMMGNKMLRFFTVEHTLMMLIAAVLVTIGYSKAKRADSDKKKFKMQALFFTVALILVLAAIPWPFREALGANWF